MPTAATQACCGSVVSSRSRGSWCQASADAEVVGGQKSTDAAEVTATVGVCLATCSRSTPSTCVRSSSAEANRSAGSVAQHLETSQ